jgi:hypothetical protein
MNQPTFSNQTCLVGGRACSDVCKGAFTEPKPSNKRCQNVYADSSLHAQPTNNQRLCTPSSPRAQSNLYLYLKSIKESSPKNTKLCSPKNIACSPETDLHRYPSWAWQEKRNLNDVLVVYLLLSLPGLLYGLLSNHHAWSRRATNQSLTSYLLV